MRLRPARALPEWDDDDPLFPCVLSLYAFGLAECQQFALAEDPRPPRDRPGRRSVRAGAQAPAARSVPWAVHAVLHAMEMQGRFDEGAAWLRQQQERWTDGTRFASHLWWHLALFRLEGLDVTGTLRLVDTHFSGPALAHGLQCVDAASLYWRLRMMDVEVGALFKDLLRRWAPDPAAGRRRTRSPTGTWSSRCWAPASALEAEELGGALRRARDARRGGARAATPRGRARGLGLPLMRALLAADRGDADAAVRGLYLVHESPTRLGGGHVRRDLIAQTLMQGAAKTSQARRMSSRAGAERALPGQAGDAAHAPLGRQAAGGGRLNPGRQRPGRQRDRALQDRRPTAARRPQACGRSRACMPAAWRSPDGGALRAPACREQVQRQTRPSPAADAGSFHAGGPFVQRERRSAHAEDRHEQRGRRDGRGAVARQQPVPDAIAEQRVAARLPDGDRAPTRRRSAWASESPIWRGPYSRTLMIHNGTAANGLDHTMKPSASTRPAARAMRLPPAQQTAASSTRPTPNAVTPALVETCDATIASPPMASANAGHCSAFRRSRYSSADSPIVKKTCDWITSDARPGEMSERIAQNSRPNWPTPINTPNAASLPQLMAGRRMKKMNGRNEKV